MRTEAPITLAAIVFGVTGLILSGGFVQDIFVQLGEAIIQSETGHVQVFREDFREKGNRQPDRYLIEDPAPISNAIRCVPTTPRHCEIPQPTLADIRAKIEKHIKGGYLKSVQAPITVFPALKAWMELN